MVSLLLLFRKRLLRSNDGVGANWSGFQPGNNCCAKIGIVIRALISPATSAVEACSADRRRGEHHAIFAISSTLLPFDDAAMFVASLHRAVVASRRNRFLFGPVARSSTLRALSALKSSTVCRSRISELPNLPIVFRFACVMWWWTVGTVIPRIRDASRTPIRFSFILPSYGLLLTKVAYHPT
jgi:hypothetical protein